MELKYICSQMVRVLHCNTTHVNRKEQKCLSLMITIIGKKMQRSQKIITEKVLPSIKERTLWAKLCAIS